MIRFFLGLHDTVYAVGTSHTLSQEDITKLCWLFGDAESLEQDELSGTHIGPRKEMITPWSTNAVEITQNMGIRGIQRIEMFHRADEDHLEFDRMLQMKYSGLDQEIFDIAHDPEPVREIKDIAAYNKAEGLALSDEEIEYLESVSRDLGRKLTDSEVFGFSQVNSEHCRHKIFNGEFIIDGETKHHTLFQLIKETSKRNPNFIVSAYKDNVAFIEGPEVDQFAPVRQDIADFFATRRIETVLSLKAETHNFPTTVEPFNGAATGSGGEIRDRLAGGKGSLPLAGTAVYMTSYPRTADDKPWENEVPERPWLYQTPLDILIKASDGASDFGNKFGQPLISGSLLTFEHKENDSVLGYDKVIMLAGGIGFGKKSDSQKGQPVAGDRIIVMGGDNYRIGMGGGAVSSVDTGEFDNRIELNAVQRSNPEMQKRVMNAIRAMQEQAENPIVSIHDHGAGGHLNCLSELVEASGGRIEVNKLPVGDPTLSDKEIIGNESQERMGLVMHQKDVETLRKVAERERAPIYEVGEVTSDHKFVFENKKTGHNPMDWSLGHMFGSSPRTILEDTTSTESFAPVSYDADMLNQYIEQVLQLEAVACKDWLTNKVDRSVTGKVATQQTCGSIQLPLNNVGVMALDYSGFEGVATSIGHAPVAALADPGAGSRLAVAEALTNLVWAPLRHGLNGVSLSANWMWPTRNAGENARLYAAVEALSEFAISLGINVPTGKDSLSMTQKYPDGKTVSSPGTVIVSSVGEVSDIRKTITPVADSQAGGSIYYIDFAGGAFSLDGSSFAQVISKIGATPPDVQDSEYFAKCFHAIQILVGREQLVAGHDIASGGLITTLLEMCFPSTECGLDLDLSELPESDLVKILFSEKPGVVVQVRDNDIANEVFEKYDLLAYRIGQVTTNHLVDLRHRGKRFQLNVHELRNTWFTNSYLMDRNQRETSHAEQRYANFAVQPLNFHFPEQFSGSLADLDLSLRRTSPGKIKCAIIREKGVNGDREMAWTLYQAGFEVKDIHMTDLISGREDLSDVQMIVFVGGFSNSDVLGSAKGWAGAFIYNEKANKALKDFYAREDTLSLGVCNGCQLMMELGLLYPDRPHHPKMHHNSSGKFESAFVNIEIPENNSVMLSALAGSRLGVWLAHGEGKFVLPEGKQNYGIAAQYAYENYPGNPNGSDFATAALISEDGRHLAIMPHIERSLYPWNWAYYPSNRSKDEVSPWIIPFISARIWLENQNVL
ncbi:phosphoribosylformylglycinamidine synthase [Fulvivirga sedimenti]|uniref:Phosphoribosylformylglycinamidine synthase n=1 Tax=Fulvivirga sedimenti TaxID=2879465 RepID=A0A9X1HVW3_9BACT|nr:phosphoribosylformylglycinamidine synthase [Fulvivirga sedimenti]MCA6075422.1 phosphoribosylformylglycinamidine synthase [Fulvivirga sedimenti]MCA6076599.1 phosphoribosylformylglycinamidine synthase [Fulvivirga sedimenti]MCA6077727.1 phosphoribosylformylglycinamidine synthase [Fulvivirga sedimenti]